MASDEKPRLRPCPAYRQFVSALNSIGGLGAAHPTLIMDNPDGPAYLALTGDARNRALLTAISILTLHASETPGPEPLVNA